MGKGLLPAAERLVDRVNRMVRAGLDNIHERDEQPSYARTSDEALFLVRDRLGKLIVEQRQLQRQIAGLPDTGANLSDKAEIAVRRGREDLARAAFSEASRLDRIRDALISDLAGVEADILLLEQAVGCLSNGQAPTDFSTRVLLSELERLARDTAIPDGGA